ncbi:hypothetical protein V6N11_061196 [Hibiscus sabdariffa]|uniref:Uncharacterized protein n=2 Tax=Hibiscus sabdariffa TaxID=183260 RepID=A0ABR2NUY2_9ROSI
MNASMACCSYCRLPPSYFSVQKLTTRSLSSSRLDCSQVGASLLTASASASALPIANCHCLCGGIVEKDKQTDGVNIYLPPAMILQP